MSVSYCYPYIHTITEDITIDTNYFAARDLQLFVESLETISRIKRARAEKKLKKETQVQTLHARVELSLPPTLEEESEEESSPSSTSLETLEKPVSKLNPDYVVAYDSDEAYGSNNNSPRNSIAFQTNLTESDQCQTSTLIRSNSEESGVFQSVADQKENPIYENIVPIRPRSEVITKPKHKSRRAKIISMVLKRNYFQGDDQESRDRVIDEAIQHQFECRSTLNQTKKKQRKGFSCKKSGTVEERFLDKALRYLTL